MTNYDDIFDQWIREKQILDRCSSRTIDSDRDAWGAFRRYRGVIAKDGVKMFVLNAVDAALTPRTINSYASGINSFLTWLHSNGYIGERLRVPLQPTQKKVLPTYTPEDARRVLSYKPQNGGERRLSAILHLIADAGLRIDECLTLPRSAVNWENCLVRVTGKGSKVRTVPISLACRAVLFRWSQLSEHPLLFSTASGAKLSVHNLRRDLLRLLEKCGVAKPAGSFPSVPTGARCA